MRYIDLTVLEDREGQVKTMMADTLHNHDEIIANTLLVRIPNAQNEDLRILISCQDDKSFHKLSVCIILKHEPAIHQLSLVR